MKECQLGKQLISLMFHLQLLVGLRKKLLKMGVKMGVRWS